ncbi:TetR/AcrR family transcriptional regulator [Actinosynnema sp. NPDC050436]|uniref:TetR/AcrR family transcriptional regulator n=1 Tax=Actinosynnema sp. NPDC050436 TaxID=3155659 RepID=UPI0034102632
MKVDGRVERGEQTRRQILRRAAEIASVEGLEGLSIGRLATELGVSKSGVFAHFGSKEELQLATVRAAAKIFVDEVVTPAGGATGLARLERLLDGWLAYSQRRTFPGGCFFYSVQAEFDARPGRVRDSIAEFDRSWAELVRTAAADVPGLVGDPAQLAFEVVAYLDLANARSVLHGDTDAYARARTAVRRALDRATRQA